MIQKLCVIVIGFFLVSCSTSATYSANSQSCYDCKSTQSEDDLFYLNLIRDILINLADEKPYERANKGY